MLDFAYRSRSPLSFRRHNRLKLIIGAVVCFLLFHECFLPHQSIARKPITTEDGVCPNTIIANDVLVVLRTGTTEALEKLPVHFATTLRCVPHYVIYSDHEEDIQEQRVYDALDQVSENTKALAPEFQLYQYFQLHGREGLNMSEHLGSGPSGSPENVSWKLDRFKFLPMVDKALQHRPEAKWLVFVEADTYLVWQNLLQYLNKFDSTKDWYIGKQMFIGEVLFAHGGSGFILSSSAAHKVTDRWKTNIAEYDEYTLESWAGDMVLGKVLKDAGVDLFWSFPHLQGDPVSSLDHNISKIDRRPWCYPPITYHHMREEDIRNLWAFEHTRQSKEDGPLLHQDVFREYIVPKLAERVDGWDNLSIDPELHEGTSLEDCRAKCKAKQSCMQYSYAAGKCASSAEVRLGNKAGTRCMEYSTSASKCISYDEESHIGDTIQSGWMLERLPNYMKEMDSLCGDGDPVWVV